MKKNAIMFVVLMMLVPCLLQAKWITLIPGFNDSTAIFEVTHSDDDSTIVEIEIPGVWADSIYVDNTVYWKIRVEGFEDIADSFSLPNMLIKKGLLYVPDSNSLGLTITDYSDTLLTGFMWGLLYRFVCV